MNKKGCWTGCFFWNLQRFGALPAPDTQGRCLELIFQDQGQVLSVLVLVLNSLNQGMVTKRQRIVKGLDSLRPESNEN